MFVAVGLLALLSVSMTGCGSSDDGFYFFPTKTPDAPTGVLATFNNASSATVSWNAVDDATSYNVYYADASGVTKDVYDVTVNTAGTSYTFEGAEQLAVDTTYYFVVTAVKGSKESVESLQVSAKYTIFAQTDLEGSWYVTNFWTGADKPLGWIRMKITLDAEGTATIDTYEQSDGTTAIPMGNLSFTIAPDGIVTQGGDFGGLDSHNVMSSNKELIVGTNDYSDTVKEIRICQKIDPLVVFADADLMGKTFAFHELASGAEVGWARGDGTIDSLLVSTITFFTDSAGGVTPPLDDVLSIDANGIVTSDNDPFFAGTMSSDKKLVVGTTRDEGDTSYQLRIIQVTGATFTMGDLAGTYNLSSLFDGASALWQYGTLTINSSGLTSFLTYLDSTGSSVLPPNYILSMTALGSITSAADVTAHGTMSFNKDLFVSTATVNPGGEELYGLSLAIPGNKVTEAPPAVF